MISEITLTSLIPLGLSQREIAAYLGCSQATVKYWLKTYNLKTNRKLCNRKKFKCIRCGETDITKAANVGGNRISKSICKECHNLNTIERFRQYKLDAIAYKGGSCIKCEYNRCPGALSFHHRDSNIKDPDWSVMRNRSLNQIREELDKCDLLCFNCHMEEHWGRSDNGSTGALQASSEGSIPFASTKI